MAKLGAGRCAFCNVLVERKAPRLSPVQDAVTQPDGVAMA
jgi:hypothetical protein